MEFDSKCDFTPPTILLGLLMQESQEMWVQSLGWEDPLEEGMATHSSYSCLENPVDRGARWATVHGVTKSQT